MAVALATPIIEGREEDWKDFMRQLAGPRADEFQDMNRRYGLERHEAWLQESDDGPALSIVFMEGPGAQEFDAKVARSDHPFDRWFLEQLGEVHPIDPEADPGPPPERWLP
jgi:hypothetical protein